MARDGVAQNVASVSIRATHSSIQPTGMLLLPSIAENLQSMPRPTKLLYELSGMLYDFHEWPVPLYGRVVFSDLLDS